ncbi:MAG: HAMP domain-containing protein [Balneolaceae bacterium]|nr:HAMP domain-containing protein [Balneolaceae bacterium]
MLIAAIGITSNKYSNSLQKQLVSENSTATRMVELTASIESYLYQSLFSLSSLNEVEDVGDDQITFDEPNAEMLIERFEYNIKQVHQAFDALEQVIQINQEVEYEEINQLIALSTERFLLYEQLSIEWLELRKEEIDPHSTFFTTSINPYFRVNILPIINELRQEVIHRQFSENARLDAQIQMAGYVIIILSAILLLISVGIAFYLYRSIANPLRMLSKSAEALGAGDLEQQVEIKNEDEIGELANSFNTMALNLRKRTLARDYLDSIIESINEALFVTDDHQHIVGCNKAALNLLKLERSALIDRPLKSVFGQEFQSDISGNTHTVANLEAEVVDAHGKHVPILYSSNDLKNAKNEIVGKVLVATDITQRKMANEQIRKNLHEKNILLAEIHHRVKNNLAVISGILQLQQQSSSNNQVKEVLTESQARIQSISLVHERLYQSETLANIDYSYYIKDLLRELSKSQVMQGKRIELSADVSPVKLDLVKAVPCSLLLNEIIVDRIKHAFKKGEEGFINVHLKQIDSDVFLSVSHSGSNARGFDSNPKESLGLTLIQTLIKQIHGEYSEQRSSENETEQINIRFPIIE